MREGWEVMSPCNNRSRIHANVSVSNSEDILENALYQRMPRSALLGKPDIKMALDSCVSSHLEAHHCSVVQPCKQINNSRLALPNRMHISGTLPQQLLPRPCATKSTQPYLLELMTRKQSDGCRFYTSWH